METKTGRWTIILDRYEVESSLQEGLYAIKDIKLDGKTFRCQSASLIMKAGEVVQLLLVVMPRHLEVVTEDPSGE